MVSYLKIRPVATVQRTTRHSQNQGKIFVWIIRVLSSVFVSSFAVNSPRVEAACHIQYHCQQCWRCQAQCWRHLPCGRWCCSYVCLTDTVDSASWSLPSALPYHCERERERNIRSWWLKWQRWFIPDRSRCGSGQGERLTHREVCQKQPPKLWQCEAASFWPHHALPVNSKLDTFVVTC